MPNPSNTLILRGLPRPLALDAWWLNGPKPTGRSPIIPQGFPKTISHRSLRPTPVRAPQKVSHETPRR